MELEDLVKTGKFLAETARLYYVSNDITLNMWPMAALGAVIVMLLLPLMYTMVGETSEFGSDTYGLRAGSGPGAIHELDYIGSSPGYREASFSPLPDSLSGLQNLNHRLSSVYEDSFSALPNTAIESLVN